MSKTQAQIHTINDTIKSLGTDIADLHKRADAAGHCAADDLLMALRAMRDAYRWLAHAEINVIGDEEQAATVKPEDEGLLFDIPVVQPTNAVEQELRDMHPEMAS